MSGSPAPSWNTGLSGVPEICTTRTVLWCTVPAMPSSLPIMWKTTSWPSCSTVRSTVMEPASPSALTSRRTLALPSTS